MRRVQTRKFYFDQVLLPDGWQHGVLVRVGEDGIIRSVEQGIDNEEALIIEGAAIPGMTNVHSHAFQRVMSGLTERSQVESFYGWREVMYRFANRISPDQLRTIATQLYSEMLISGYTSVAEFHYLHADKKGRGVNQTDMSLALLDAAHATGIGLTLVPVLYQYAGFGCKPPEPGQNRFVSTLDGYAKLISELRSKLAGYPGARLGIGAHSLRAVPVENLNEIVSLFPELPVHIHIAEQLQEVEDCVRFCGSRPVQWLMDNAEVNERWSLIHATHVNSAEIDQLATSGALVGLCPSTEGNLADGVAPAHQFYRQGVRIGLGSDSNICVDPLAELRMLEYSQRLLLQKRNILTGHKGDPGLWQYLARCGAGALDRPVGLIAPGYQADFIVLDPFHPALLGRHGEELMDSFMFAANSKVISDVYVAGVQRLKSGRIMKIERYRDDFQKVMVELLSS